MLAEISLVISSIIFIAFNFALYLERKKGVKRFQDLREKMDTKVLRLWALFLNFKKEMRKRSFYCKARYFFFRVLAIFLQGIKVLAAYLERKSKKGLQKIEKAEASKHLQEIQKLKSSL